MNMKINPQKTPQIQNLRNKIRKVVGKAILPAAIALGSYTLAEVAYRTPAEFIKKEALSEYDEAIANSEYHMSNAWKLQNEANKIASIDSSLAKTIRTIADREYKEAMANDVRAGEAGARYSDASEIADSDPLAVQLYDACVDRVETYKGLKDNGMKPLQYLGNYGKAQAALDSVKTYNFCKDNGLTPTSVEDAHFVKDSLEMRQYGIEPYGRNADEFGKDLKQLSLENAKTIAEMEAFLGVIQAKLGETQQN